MPTFAPTGSMLYDREYMRPEEAGTPWFRWLSVCSWLIVVNVAMYAAQHAVPLFGATPGGAPVALEPYLALFPQHLLHGRLWELFTFQLLHGGLLHLILNCAMLYMFGRPLEAILGRWSFLGFYFASGAVGGLVQCICSWVFPWHFGFGPVVGASAGIFGLIAAFACLNPNLSITTLVAFIIPVTMRAIYLIPVQVVIAGLGMLDRSSDIAHAAHLGGMLAGIAYVQFWLRRGVLPWSAPRLFRRRAEPELVRATVVRAGPPRKTSGKAEEGLPPAEFISREVDPILEKISAHGIQSLSERERRILELARDKMRRR